MIFGGRRKRERAVEQAVAAILGGGSADETAVDALPAELRLPGLIELARRLGQEDAPEMASAIIKRALALDPDQLEALELDASLEQELGRSGGAIAAWQRILELEPANEEAAGTLARLLIDAERAAEAIELLEGCEDSPDLALRLGEALYVTGRAEEALAILETTCQAFERALKLTMGPDWQSIQVALEEALRLRDDVAAELHGREATIEAHLRDGMLDARAGVNYRLLGAALAAKSRYLPEVLELESAADCERRAGEILARDPDEPRGLVLLGSAHLRRGELDLARQLFESATSGELSFAAYFGLGAVLDQDRHRLRARIKAMRAAPAIAGIEGIVPDYPALTDEEKRVVCASAHPLRALLERVREREARIRILPIDVRVTNLPELAGVAGRRAEDDHRSYDALGGIATHGCAAVKIEELLEVVAPGGWTFAHELAHLAFFHAPDRIREAVEDLFEDALDHGYACGEYELSNPDEFFAVAYTDYLRVEHDLPQLKESDDQGLNDTVLAFFRDLAG